MVRAQLQLELNLNQAQLNQRQDKHVSENKSRAKFVVLSVSQPRFLMKLASSDRF